MNVQGVNPLASKITAMNGCHPTPCKETTQNVKSLLDWNPLEPALGLTAGTRYGQYACPPKPKKGRDRRILADFLILAYAEAQVDLLLTFDAVLFEVASNARVVYTPDWIPA